MKCKRASVTIPHARRSEAVALAFRRQPAAAAAAPARPQPTRGGSSARLLPPFLTLHPPLLPHLLTTICHPLLKTILHTSHDLAIILANSLSLAHGQRSTSAQLDTTSCRSSASSRHHRPSHSAPSAPSSSSTSFSRTVSMTRPPAYYNRNIAVTAQIKVAEDDHCDFATTAQHIATRPALSQVEQHSSS